MKACMLVKTEVGREEDVAARLSKTSGIQDAWTVFGDHEVVALLEVDDLEELDQAVSEAATVEGIMATETLPQMEVA